jgi:cell wall-associated NlpC family hydrolase
MQGCPGKISETRQEACGGKDKPNPGKARQGKPVAIKDIQAGDLVFFKNTSDQVVHVGIFIGEDKIIHASGKVRIDHLNEEGILHAESKVYTHTFSHVRRVISE